MVGKYEIEIYNNRVHFHLEIKRNITIIQGDSATGKSTLIGLIADYERLGSGSGITLICDRPCMVLSIGDWHTSLLNRHEHIIFLDENMPFIKSREFADLVNHSDNYFVLIYRDSLPQLAYSIEEIYGIREDRDSQKYIHTKRVYNEMYRLYNLKTPAQVRPKTIITEDTNAGYDFWTAISACKCISAEGKSRIHKVVGEAESEASPILAVVDGAAFGADMERFMREIRGAKTQCVLFAPESFEFLILRSGVVDVPRQMLDAPYEYADSQKYASWEQFFTALLRERTANSPLHYAKTSLNKAYLAEKTLQRIKSILPPLIDVNK